MPTKQGCLFPAVSSICTVLQLNNVFMNSALKYTFWVQDRLIWMSKYLHFQKVTTIHLYLLFLLIILAFSISSDPVCQYKLYTFDYMN